MVWIVAAGIAALALAFAKLGAMSVWVVVLSVAIKAGMWLLVLTGVVLISRVLWKRWLH